METLPEPMGYLNHNWSGSTSGFATHFEALHTLPDPTSPYSSRSSIPTCTYNHSRQHSLGEQSVVDPIHLRNGTPRPATPPVDGFTIKRFNPRRNEITRPATPPVDGLVQ